MLGDSTFQVIDKLFIGVSAKRSHNKRLRFPTGKES
jgi:hypothetical protein